MRKTGRYQALSRLSYAFWPQPDLARLSCSTMVVAIALKQLPRFQPLFSSCAPSTFNLSPWPNWLLIIITRQLRQLPHPGLPGVILTLLKARLLPGRKRRDQGVRVSCRRRIYNTTAFPLQRELWGFCRRSDGLFFLLP